MITLTSYSESALVADEVRLQAATRSHRLWAVEYSREECRECKARRVNC